MNVRIWEEYRNTPITDTDMKQLTGKINGLISCRQDVLQPESLTEYQRLLPRAEHPILTACAHFPWEERPNDYYRVLFKLLDGKPGLSRVHSALPRP